MHDWIMIFLRTRMVITGRDADRISSEELVTDIQKWLAERDMPVQRRAVSVPLAAISRTHTDPVTKATFTSKMVKGRVVYVGIRRA